MISSRAQPPLANTLSVILPPSDGTLFLRACLNSGQAGRQACQIWLKDHADTQTVLRKEATKAFFPLFYYAAQTHGIEFDNGLSTILRTAALREELRTNTYRAICRDVFSVLVDNQVPSLVVGGAAFADTIYPNPALRHSHDIDILLKPSHLELTLNLLNGLGFTLHAKPKTNQFDDIHLRHHSGLPLVLCAKLFHNPFYNALVSGLWTRSQTATVADVPIQVLSPADAVLCICGRASYPDGRESYHWVVDAWFTIHGNRDLDWNLLAELAKTSHLALPLFVMLNYLAKEIDAPIPRHFLTLLSNIASRTTTIGRELALFGARSAAHAGFRNLLRKTQGWYGRVLVIQWMILPSPAYVRWIQQVHNSWVLPFCYLSRYVKYFSRYLCPQFKYLLRRKMIQTSERIFSGRFSMF